MFHKLIYVEEKDVPERVRKATEGEHPIPNLANHLPVGLREITMEEFAQSEFFTYTPEFARYNQCPLTAGGVNEGWHEYWYSDGTGFAFIHDYWGKKVRVFRMGCAHAYRSVSRDELDRDYPEHKGKYQRGTHMHNEVCTKCRVFRCYDSSG